MTGDAVADHLRVGLESDDTAVAVAKRVNPGEPMVCGSDGQTYNNDCLMKYATCISNNVITLAYRGKCNATDGSLSQYGELFELR